MRFLYLPLFLLFAFPIFVRAQSDTLLIKLKDNTVERIAVSQIQKVEFENLTDVNDTQPAINNLQLGGNYPNPFVEQTSIEFDLATSGNIEVTIFDNTGKKVQTLICEGCLAGTNTLHWNSLDRNQNRVQSGSYYYEVRFGNEIQSRKMIVVK